MTKPDQKFVIVVAGPTAVGKTALAITLAKAFRTEIISADSRQIFREMTIGTAKPSANELAQVRHHFINSHSINEDYDAATFGDEALVRIRQLFEHSDTVVVCGGSGLYIKALLEGFDDIPEVPASIREKLSNDYAQHGISWLQEQLALHDPGLYGQIDTQNPHRLIRALEVHMATGKSITAFRKNEKRKLDFDVIKIGLELPRDLLYERIDNRMDKMIEEGLFEEAQKLYPFRAHQALQTVGYQEIFGFMDGQYDRDEAIRLLKRNSRRYAKRQLTWFKRDTEIRWFRPDQQNEIFDYIASHGVQRSH